MKYTYDLTGIDDCFFPPEYGIVENYLSLNLCNKNISMSSENMEIYISWDEFLENHRKNYPNSILSTEDYSDDCWCFLKKININLYEIKMLSVIIEGNNEKFFHTIGNFNAGDRVFFIKGYSKKYKNIKITMFIVYSLKIEVMFEESDIVPITLNFKEVMNNDNIIKINKEKYLEIDRKSNKFISNLVNNKRCNFFNNDFFMDYFKDGIAIKNYLEYKNIDESDYFSL